MHLVIPRKGYGRLRLSAWRWALCFKIIMTTPLKISVVMVLLVSTLSVGYYFIEESAKDMFLQRQAGCAEQAQKAVKQYYQETTEITRVGFLSSQNHYSQKQGKCFVFISDLTREVNLVELIDAYQHSTVVSCVLSRNNPHDDYCVNGSQSVTGNGARITKDDFDRLLNQYMNE